MPVCSYCHLPVYGDISTHPSLVDCFKAVFAALNASYNAIRKHRDQGGDNRCYLDDYNLYASLPEGYTPPPYDTKVELENCIRYIHSRQDPAVHYVSPQTEIERLRDGIKQLRDGIGPMNAAPFNVIAAELDKLLAPSPKPEG